MRTKDDIKHTKQRLKFMKKKPVEYTQFSIRVPKDLDALIQEDADENKRSKNLQVNVVLEKHYSTGMKFSEIEETGKLCLENLQEKP